MARPTTKDQLIQAGEENFNKLMEVIDSLSVTQQEMIFSFEDRDRNIRDVLIHLYEWHQLLLNWIKKNQDGEKCNFLPEPYNWKTYPQMNVEFWKKHQETLLEDSIDQLKKSNSAVIDTIKTFTNEELFTNKHFNWTGTTSLGSYCVSSTSSHYDWAIKKIKKHKKTLS